MQKRVSVTFAGDEDVLDNILPLNKRKTRSQNATIDQMKLAQASQDDSDSSEGEDDAFKPSQALTEEDEGVLGSEVFGFKTPKKATQMATAASKSAQAATTPKTPKTPKSSVKRTPGRSILKKNTSLSDRKVCIRLRRIEATTPHRLRARNRQDDDVSSDESVSSESEDENDDDDNEAVAMAAKRSSTPSRAKNKPSISNTPVRRRGRMRKGAEDEEGQVKPHNVEEYFDAHTGDTAATSDRTLARLQTPRMDQEAVCQALAGVEMGYREERKALYEEYRSCFNRWMYLLCNGYNLLFHGLGSKRRLLEEFRSTILKDFNHLVINGYFPSLTIKQIVSAIIEEIMEHKAVSGSPLDQCHFIKQYYECRDYEDFYLIIHNIDGAMLRPEKAQAVLSALAQIRGFHIIASIDHINAPLIWDQTKASSFNWLWQDVTTYEAYLEETSYENSLLVQQSGTLALSSLNHVMKSLPTNARGIFMLLANYQLEHCDNSSYQGLAFPDMYQKCREAFLVNSDLTLRSQLTEFKDHKLIKVKKAIDGLEYLVIPLDGATLREFIQQNEDDSL